MGGLRYQLIRSRSAGTRGERTLGLPIKGMGSLHYTTRKCEHPDLRIGSRHSQAHSDLGLRLELAYAEAQALRLCCLLDTQWPVRHFLEW